jgi:hypothetical protein
MNFNMKNNWIKVEDSLPELYKVSDEWSTSTEVLCTDGENLYIAHYTVLLGEERWDGFSNYKNITHWQYVELP